MARRPCTAAATPRRRHTLGPEILDHTAVAVDDGHPLPDPRQDRRQLFLVGDAADRQRRANLAGAAGAPDPVDLSLYRVRKVEIHHHAEA